jgi:ethanolamine ammonia-lyase large subunit
MVLRTKLHGKTYEFPDFCLLMGKAKEAKSGDRLAGVTAETAAKRVAARFILAEMPLWVRRQHPVIPYEQDEVTRVMQEAVHEPTYQEIQDGTVGQLRDTYSMTYRPKAGDTDADRDVVSNIFANGGTDPLAGAASILQMTQKMMQYQASGVKLKLATS